MPSGVRQLNALRHTVSECWHLCSLLIARPWLLCAGVVHICLYVSIGQWLQHIRRANVRDTSRAIRPHHDKIGVPHRSFPCRICHPFLRSNFYSDLFPERDSMSSEFSGFQNCMFVDETLFWLFSVQQGARRTNKTLAYLRFESLDEVKPYASKPNPAIGTQCPVLPYPSPLPIVRYVDSWVANYVARSWVKRNLPQKCQCDTTKPRLLPT